MADVHGIVLLVFCGDLAGLVIIFLAELLDEHPLFVDGATNGGLEFFRNKAMLLDFVDMEVGARFGRLETETVQKVDVRLGTMTLVVLVMDHLDLGETKVLLDLGLGRVDGVHGDSGLLGNMLVINNG